MLIYQCVAILKNTKFNIENPKNQCQTCNSFHLGMQKREKEHNFKLTLAWYKNMKFVD